MGENASLNVCATQGTVGVGWALLNPPPNAQSMERVAAAKGHHGVEPPVGETCQTHDTVYLGAGDGRTAAVEVEEALDPFRRWRCGLLYMLCHIRRALGGQRWQSTVEVEEALDTLRARLWFPHTTHCEGWFVCPRGQYDDYRRGERRRRRKYSGHGATPMEIEEALDTVVYSTHYFLLVVLPIYMGKQETKHF